MTRRALTIGQLAQAACGNADPNLFGERTPRETHADSRYRAALRYCDTCPIRQACYDVADSWHDASGIFGGVLFADGRTSYQPKTSAERSQGAAAERELRHGMSFTERRDEMVYGLVRSGLTHEHVAEQTGLAVVTVERSLTRTRKRQAAAKSQGAAA